MSDLSGALNETCIPHTFTRAAQYCYEFLWALCSFSGTFINDIIVYCGMETFVAMV